MQPARRGSWLSERLRALKLTRRATVFAGLVLVALVGAVALSLTLGDDDPSTNRRGEQAQAQQLLVQPDPSISEPSESTSTDAALDSPPPAAPRDPAPVRTIRSHLYQLGHSGYAAAFALMSARYRQANPRWVALRSAADPTIRTVSVGSPVYTTGGARVHVVFFARDVHPVRGSDTKCRRFEGRVALIKRGDAWRYDPLARPLTSTERPRAACN